MLWQSVRSVGLPTLRLSLMPFVDGVDIVTMMRASDNQVWDDDHAQLSLWMLRAGVALAAFHEDKRRKSDVDLDLAMSDVTRLADRFRISASHTTGLLEAAEWRDKCVASYGDFGPGNLLGTSDGLLYLLDPPTDPPPAILHRDIGNFLFELRRQFAGRGYTRAPVMRDAFAALRSDFLAGYSSHGSRRSLGDADDALIALFEMARAAGMARKRFPGRTGDSIWFLKFALARRREVTNAG